MKIVKAIQFLSICSLEIGGFYISWRSIVFFSGLCKDDSNSQSISEPDPELVEEPAVDPTVSESNDNVASSVPFMPSLDLSLRTRQDIFLYLILFPLDPFFLICYGCFIYM